MSYQRYPTPFGPNGRLIGSFHGRPIYIWVPRSLNRVTNHPTINPNAFSQSLVRSRNKFESSHLAEIFARTAGRVNPRDKLTPQQMQTLRSPIPDCGDDRRLSKQLVVEWFDIFNSLFFAGGLRDLRDRINVVRGIHVPGGDPATAGDRFLYGQFEGGAPGSRGRLYINHDLQVRPGKRREEEWVKSLCHEMVHAFIGYYRCNCGGCQAKDHPSQGGEGVEDGHGPAWADSMLAVGQAAQDLVPWDFTDVNIPGSVQQTMDKYNWMPTNEQLTRWGSLVGQGIPGGIIRRRQGPQPQPIFRSPPGSTPGRYRGPGARGPDEIRRRPRPQQPPVIRSPPGSPPGRRRGPGARGQDGFRDGDDDDDDDEDGDEAAQIQAAIALSLQDRGPAARHRSGARPARGREQDRPSMAEPENIYTRRPSIGTLEAAFERGYNEGYDQGAANRASAPPERTNRVHPEFESMIIRGYNEGYEQAVLRRDDSQGGGGGQGAADEAEDLRRALEASRLDAGRGSRPRTPPRPRDPYEDETRALVEQFQRENGGANEVVIGEDYEEDYEDASERLIRQMMEEDIARSQGQ